VVLAGLVQGVRTMVVKTGRSAGQKMGVITLETRSAPLNAWSFSDAFAKFGHLALTDQIVFVLGRIDLSRGSPQVGHRAAGPHRGSSADAGRFRLTIPGVRLNGTGEATIHSVAAIVAKVSRPPRMGTPGCRNKPRRFPVELVVETEAGRALLATDPRLKIAPSPDMVAQLARLLGDGGVRVVGGVSVEMNSGNGKRDFRSGGKPEFARRG
jgi:DNA polymerase III alpha subunit